MFISKCFVFLFKIAYLFLAALHLCCCTRAFSSRGERGLLLVGVRWRLLVMASLVAEGGLYATQASRVAAQ